jgi:hypothetical protein
MNKNENNLDNKDNQEEINLNNLFNIIANANDASIYLDSINCFFEEYFSLCKSQYNSFNQLYDKYFSNQNESIINNKIYQIDSTIKSILKINLAYMKSFESNNDLFNLIKKQISDLGKILKKLPSLSYNFSLNGKNTDEANQITYSLNKAFSDLEMKIIEEYIKEKYNKKISGIDNKESIENLVCLIKYLENSLLNVTKQRKITYFNKLKEPDDKINKATNNISNSLLIYISKIKENNKILNEELLKIENDIKSNNFKEAKQNQKEEVILSKDDFIPKDEINIYKYKLKVIKKIKLPLELNEINEKEIKNDKKDLAAKFDDKFIYLNEQDVYNITEKLYNYNFFALDKSKYNLAIEKGKIEALKLSTEILSFLGADKNKQELLEKNFDEFKNSANEKILNNFENMKEFYIVLNNHRGKSKNQFSEKLFELCIYIFQKTLNFLLQNRNLELEDLMIILSQTFFKEENGKKKYICDIIKSHDLYKKENFWEEIVVHKIEEEFKLKKKLIQQDLNIINTSQKKDETIATKLIPLGSIMIEFDFPKKKAIEVVEKVLKKYKCGKDTKEQIISFLKNFEVDNK